MEATLDRYIESTLGVRERQATYCGDADHRRRHQDHVPEHGPVARRNCRTSYLPLSAVYAAVAYYYDHKGSHRSQHRGESRLRRGVSARSSSAVAGEN